MAGTGSSFDPEALLAETAWMHGLARGLVVSADGADDLVQETWLRAIERPPRETRTPRAWLATVLRNVFFRSLRDEKTRRRRERRVARVERVWATPEQALERAETQQLLVDLVIHLEEPYRSAILLRFFEDMTPEEIARAEGVHVTTIRRRLRVGLDRLRALLDSRHAGDRKAWHAVLFPLLEPDGARVGTGAALSTTAVGAVTSTALGHMEGLLAMKKIVAAVAAAVLLVVMCGGILVVTMDPTSSRVDRQEPVAVTAPPTPTESTRNEGAGVPPPLPRSAILAGRASDGNSGEGVEGVLLVLGSREEGDGVRRQMQVKTDSGGAFRFDDVPPGEYTLECLDVPAGYRIPVPDSDDASLGITLDAGEVREDVDVALRPEVPLRGRVVENRAGAVTPTVGARVALIGGPDFLEIQKTVTGEDGAFAFHGLGPLESVHLAAEKDGFRTRTWSRPLSEEGRDDVLLVLDTCEEPASVSGRVVDLEGQPLAKFRVLVQNAPPNSTMILFDGFALTDGEGRFTLGRLVPGSYNFILTPHDRAEKAYQWGRLELEAGEEVADLELVYDRVYSISGRVYTPDGEAVAGAHVAAGDGGTATTDTDGRYVISRLGPHAYDLDASARNHTDGRIQGVAAGSENVDFVLTPSAFEISGRIVDAETREPLTEFELSWVQWPDDWGDAHLFSGNIYRFQSFSSPDGRFEVRDAVRSDWTRKVLLIARARGFASALELIDLDDSGPDGERVIYLRHDGDLAGVVRDAEGAPVASAELYYQHVVRMAGLDGNRTIARTLDDGSFSIPSFPQERQQIAVYHSEFAPYFIEVPRHEDRRRPLEIVMTRGGTVRGRVIPMPEARSVRVSVSQDKWRGQVTEVNEDGTFTIEKVSPQNGTARLSIAYDHFTVADYSNRYALIELPVTVEVGKTTEVDFRLGEATSVVHGKVYVGDLMAETVRVEAVIATESGIEKHSVHADADGTYLLDRLPAGEADVTATVQFQGGEERTLSSALRIRIGDGETLTRRFDLSQ